VGIEGEAWFCSASSVASGADFLHEVSAAPLTARAPASDNNRMIPNFIMGSN